MTVELYDVIASLVVALFFVGGPFTVAGLVALIVVYALNGVLRTGPVSHIGVEVFKRMPALTNGDAAATIATIGWMVGVFTTLAH